MGLLGGLKRAITGAAGSVGGLFGGRGDNEFRDVDPEGNLGGVSGQATGFGGYGESEFRNTGRQLGGVADQLSRQMTGQESLSAEQLKQSLGRNLAAQQSMAAGARPGNAAMAARTAAIQQGRLGAGLAGQQAMAGIAERQAAAQQLGNLLTQKRQQELGAALGGYGLGVQGYGAIEGARTGRFGSLTGVPTMGEQILGAGAGLGMAKLMSDRNVKTDIKSGDKDADALLEGLKAHAYRYKDERHGKGKQLGVMAQALEKAGLQQAVIETPEGKAVDTGKLAGALAAASARMHQRLKKLEKKAG